jgi:hypothetical protein
VKAGRFTGKIITACMMTAAYFLVITPAALIKRLAGGRPIPKKGDRSIVTYWIDREESAQPKERFEKRY